MEAPGQGLPLGPSRVSSKIRVRSSLNSRRGAARGSLKTVSATTRLMRCNNGRSQIADSIKDFALPPMSIVYPAAASSDPRRTRRMRATCGVKFYSQRHNVEDAFAKRLATQSKATVKTASRANSAGLLREDAERRSPENYICRTERFSPYLASLVLGRYDAWASRVSRWGSCCRVTLGPKHLDILRVSAELSWRGRQTERNEKTKAAVSSLASPTTWADARLSAFRRQIAAPREDLTTRDRPQ
jgi:hypothetical protein